MSDTDGIFEFMITGQAYGGEGMGRDPQGRMVFVPYTANGERVLVRTVEEHKRWARAEVIELLAPAEERVPPRCPHYRSCGGCHYQHLPYEAQLNTKSDIVRDQLRRIGKLDSPAVANTIPSPSSWNYRNHLQFSLTREGRLGFHKALSQRIGGENRHEMDPPLTEVPAFDKSSAQDQVLEIHECHLPQASLISIWESLDLEHIPGLNRVSFRKGSEDHSLILLHAEDDPEVEFSTDIPASVVWSGQSGLEILATGDHVRFQIGDRTFHVSALSFFQANTQLIKPLVEKVLEYLDPKRGETLFDLYAGVGLFSSFLLEHGVQVLAVEQSPWACRDFQQNLPEESGVELYQGNVAEALFEVNKEPQAMILDPPRSGLHPKVIDGISLIRPNRIIYISCDPARLARDTKRLTAIGYSLIEATPMDMFPQTYHIETITKFVPT